MPLSIGRPSGLISICVMDCRWREREKLRQTAPPRKQLSEATLWAQTSSLPLLLLSKVHVGVYFMLRARRAQEEKSVRYVERVCLSDLFSCCREWFVFFSTPSANPQKSRAVIMQLAFWADRLKRACRWNPRCTRAPRSYAFTSAWVSIQMKTQCLSRHTTSISNFCGRRIRSSMNVCAQNI
jgi:hypothetical protein